MTTYPKRLIEVDLPIRRISEHARREKSIRHGHISTLHIWWARRPLASCRAVICASLWPDPADEICPPAFRIVASALMYKWARESMGKHSVESSVTFKLVRQHTSSFALFNHPSTLQKALLDFIADFSNWDNSEDPDFIRVARELTSVAHFGLNQSWPPESFSVSGAGRDFEAEVQKYVLLAAQMDRPLVVDPFAGGGSIPLEALRIGANAFASDLNPIPVLINKVLLEYIPRYGERLAREVRRLGEWIKAEAYKELSDFYPVDADGAIPIAHLWARAVKCEGPSCGAVVPLIRNLQLTRNGRKWCLEVKSVGKEIKIGLVEGTTNTPGTVRGGSVTCPRCNYTTPAKAVKVQLRENRGGSENPILLAVYVERNGNRFFREPDRKDAIAFEAASQKLDRTRLPNDKINPIRPYKNSRGLSAVTRIGIETFGDLYTPRQALALLTLQEICLRVAKLDGDPEFQRAVATILHFVVSRYIFQNCALSRWNATGAKIEGAFGKQALQVVWDFAEANPFSNGSANWGNALDWVVEVIEANLVLKGSASVVRAPAQLQIIPNASAQLLATDPPYFAAIPYSDLSNVFYVWEREMLRQLHPDLYNAGLVEQEREIIVTNANQGPGDETKSPEFFTREMSLALEVGRAELAPNGIALIVFADSSTSSWEAILNSIIFAGWTVTSSWPIDTEMQNRTQAQESASLQSSVHIICRPRESTPNSSPTEHVGDWRDVLQELPRRIHDWMPRLAEEGVVGADAIFACLGPALEIFSRYTRVEKANGDAIPLKEYLEHVWSAVSNEALSMIFAGADTSTFEEDARLTAMWLWTLAAPAGSVANDTDSSVEEDDEEETKKPKMAAGFTMEYDAARKIAQGLGAHLEDLTNLVDVRGDTARLLPVSERTEYLFGKEGAEAPGAKKRKSKVPQLDLFTALIEEGGSEESWGEKTVLKPRETTLDRIHQAMILFAAGRSEALRRFLVEDGAGNDAKFWSLAQALSALYPKTTSEKRWVDGLLARKKGLGL